MKLNRELQNAILVELTNQFPNPCDDSVVEIWINEYGEEEVIGNLFYLKMHQLLTVKTSDSISEVFPQPSWSTCEPTARAFDFLADDGGLSAILNVVTVKLHADTIKAIVIAKIEADNSLSNEEKSKFKEALNTIGETALTTITEKAIEAIPVAALLAVLQSFIS